MTDSTKQGWAAGGVIFAATMMLIVGIFQIFQGIAAIAQDNFFILAPNYVYDIDTTVWGWIHLGIGVLLVAAGFYLYTGATWARVIGIAVALLSAIANFMFVPYYPVWAILLIALDVFVIWAIATVRTGYGVGMDEMAGARTGGYGGEAGRTQADRWPAANEPAGRWEPEPAKEGTTGSYAEDEAARRAAEAQRRSRR